MSERRQSLWMWVGLVALGFVVLGLMACVEYWQSQKITQYVEQRSRVFLEEDIAWFEADAERTAYLGSSTVQNLRGLLNQNPPDSGAINWNWHYEYLHREVAEVALKKAADRKKGHEEDLSKADIEREYPANYNPRLERMLKLHQIAQLKDSKAGLRSDNDTFEQLRQAIESLEVK